jgi:hypothetical protein
MKRPSRKWDPFGPYRKSTGCPETVITLAPVSEAREHVLAMIAQDGERKYLARIAPENPDDTDNGRFIVEWLISDRSPEDQELRRQARLRFDYFLFDLGKSHPWAYLCYRCTTASNMYAFVGGDVCFARVNSAS